MRAREKPERERKRNGEKERERGQEGERKGGRRREGIKVRESRRGRRTEDMNVTREVPGDAVSQTTGGDAALHLSGYPDYTVHDSYYFFPLSILPSSLKINHSTYISVSTTIYFQNIKSSYY